MMGTGRCAVHHVYKQAHLILNEKVDGQPVLLLHCLCDGVMWQMRIRYYTRWYIYVRLKADEKASLTL